MGHKPPIPERLSLEGKDFLSHCLESEPRMRWTASQLLDHSFVKVCGPVRLSAGVLFVAGTRGVWEFKYKISSSRSDMERNI